MTTSSDTMQIARRAMIDSQLRTSGVNEEYVLARMLAVAREDFVPDNQRDIAYMDRAIPLSDGRYLAAPLVHAKMISEAAPKQSDAVLIVESGSSYLAELVKPLVASVDTISVSDLLSDGPAKRKKYNLVLVDGAIERVPASLEKAITDAGRIVTGIVQRGVTRIASGRNIAGTVTLQNIADIGIPVLSEFNAPKSWSFA